ncbi:MAG TPA: hypothetical protein VFA56_04200 [Gaiellaceae bacterium]|nr:hypothetical protein [Gaiellaceae bacterium]
MQAVREQQQDKQDRQQPQKPESPDLSGLKSRYGAMRSWASFFYALGMISAVIAAVGAIILAVEVHSFWQALGILLIAGPVSIFLATLPVVFSQSLNALADVAEAVTGPDVPRDLGGPGF